MPKTAQKRKRVNLTDEQADAILRKYAPNWEEHLRQDVEVFRHVMAAIVHAK